MVKLNKDQEGLIASLMSFYKNDSEKYFLLSGQAGVGKTTCIRFFIDKIISQKVKICLCAPTNKAVKVLKQSTKIRDVSYKTIYSLLGLKMEPNGLVKELFDSGKEDAGSYDVIMIDEGSMLSSTVLDYLYKKTVFTHTKIILIGDREQLPPVGEDESPIWSRYPVDYELTEVMRHQNEILSFVQSIRANPKPKFVGFGEPVFFEDEEKFIENIRKDAKAGLFHSGKSKAVAWRNVTVNFLNKFIRECHSNVTQPWATGDRIIFLQPISIDNAMLASTDDEAIITDVVLKQHPTYPLFNIWELEVEMEDGDSIIVRVLQEEHRDKLKAYLDDLASKKQWKSYWNCKDAFNEISFGYAITAHRSQGSTFENVYVDAGDVMLNRDSDTRTKCLYVACSRASKGLHIFP